MAIRQAAANDVAVARGEARDRVLFGRPDLSRPLVLAAVRDASHPDVAEAPVLAANGAHRRARRVDALRGGVNR